MLHARIEPFDASRYLNRGLRLLVDSTDDKDRREPKDMMWWLLREAASVSNAYAAAPRTGYPVKSAMPDAPDQVTYWQRQVEAFEQGVTMHALYGTRARPQFTAQQISDASTTLRLFHHYALHGRGKRRELMRAVYAYASGAKPATVREWSGLSRFTLHRRRDQACEDMLAGLRKENPHG